MKHQTKPKTLFPRKNSLISIFLFFHSDLFICKSSEECQSLLVLDCFGKLWKFLIDPVNEVCFQGMGNQLFTWVVASLGGNLGQCKILKERSTQEVKETIFTFMPKP